MRPEPTTPIVRRGEDAWGRAAGRTPAVLGTPVGHPLRGYPASVAGPAKAHCYHAPPPPPPPPPPEKPPPPNPLPPHEPEEPPERGTAVNDCPIDDIVWSRP